MKLNLRHQSLNNKGYSLIELIMSISIASMVVACIYSMMTFSMNASSVGEQYDEILLNGRYGIELIKDDIKKADKIYATNKIGVIHLNYPKNLGFVIFQKDLDKSPQEYKYISYYLKSGSINKVTYNFDRDKKPNMYDTPGHNFVCDYVLSIKDTKVHFNEGLVKLDISFGAYDNRFYNFKSTIAINCPMEY